MSEQPALFGEEIAVACFFDCPRVVRDSDPEAAHAAMEDHYRADHRDDIAQAVAFIR